MAYTISLGIKDWSFEFVGSSWAYESGFILSSRHAANFGDPEFCKTLEWASRATIPLGFMYDWELANSGSHSPFEVHDREQAIRHHQDATLAMIEAKALIGEGVVILNDDGHNVLLEVVGFAKVAQEAFLSGYKAIELAEKRYIEKRDCDPIYQRDGGLCRYCGKDVSTGYVKDHIVPRAQGGTSKADNLALACSSCNSRKAAKTPEQAGMALRQIP